MTCHQPPSKRVIFHPLASTYVFVAAKLGSYQNWYIPTFRGTWAKKMQDHASLSLNRWAVQPINQSRMVSSSPFHRFSHIVHNDGGRSHVFHVGVLYLRSNPFLGHCLQIVWAFLLSFLTVFGLEDSTHKTSSSPQTLPPILCPPSPRLRVPPHAHSLLIERSKLKVSPSD